MDVLNNSVNYKLRLVTVNLESIVQFCRTLFLSFKLVLIILIHITLPLIFQFGAKAL